jgi:hypothetical protein
MGAYSLAITIPKCRRCQRRATERVFNTYNSHVGDFCKTHAAQMVRELNGGRA